MQQRIHQKMYHRWNVILIWESYKESTEHQSKYYRTYIVFHCSSFRSLFFQAISAMFLFLCYLLRADKTSSFAAVYLSFKVHWARNGDKKTLSFVFRWSLEYARQVYKCEGSFREQWLVIEPQFRFKWYLLGFNEIWVPPALVSPSLASKFPTSNPELFI